MRRGIITAIAVAVFALVSWCGAVAAQTKTIYIQDDHGNQAVGTVTDGNVFFHDNSGNIAVGTIKDGNVFLNTNSGETIFGTVKDGNVFLTDQAGITTGTIQNGNIFLHNSDGSITTGTYDSSGHMSTSTTGSTTIDNDANAAAQQQAREQAEYNAGYAMGSALGAGIAIAVQKHRLHSFCKKNPTGVFNNEGAFSGTPCPDAPLNASQQASVDEFCANNPGRKAKVGLRTIGCFTPPPVPNLKWARWEMGALRTDYQAQVALKSPGVEQARVDWFTWNSVFCGLSSSKASYKGLDGKKKHCP